MSSRNRRASGPKYAPGDPRGHSDLQEPDTSQYSRSAASPSRPTKPQTATYTKEEATAKAKQAAEWVPSNRTYHDLADSFKTQPWIHSYRGDTEPLPTLKVAMGEKLIAKLIAEQVRFDQRFEGWDDEKIAETVDYAMKHFFVQVPNDERDSNNLVRRFLHEDWWWPLINESIDHFKMLRTPMPDWDESQKRVEDFYAKWPKKEAVARPKNVKEAVARFNEIYARYVAEQEAADALIDEEPLT